MRRSLTTTAAAAALGSMLMLTGAMPAGAQVAGPQSAVSLKSANPLLTEVQYRRGRHFGRHYRGGRHYGWRHRYRGPGIGAGIGLGLATGAIIGSALATADAADDADAYCASRFRSYDPVSGTYLGYDGLRHPCP